LISPDKIDEFQLPKSNPSVRDPGSMGASAGIKKNQPADALKGASTGWF
jgi:hypothetical protein